MLDCFQFCSFGDRLQLASLNRQFRADSEEYFIRVGRVTNPLFTYPRLISWITERPFGRNFFVFIRKWAPPRAIHHICQEGLSIFNIKNIALVALFFHFNSSLSGVHRIPIINKIRPPLRINRVFLDIEEQANIIRQYLREHPMAVSSFTHLDLRYLNAITLPDEIEHFSGLNSINLSESQIVYLPKKFFNLRNLNLIEMCDMDQFEEFPSDIEKLTLLTHLVMNNTLCAPLPRSIYRLQNLRLVVLSREQEIESPPSSFWDTICCCFGRGPYNQTFQIIRTGRVHRLFYAYIN